MIKKIGLFILIMAVFFACVEDSDLQLTDPNVFTLDNFEINTPNDLLAFSTAAYGDLQVRGTYARHAFFIHDGMSDECEANSMEADKQQMHDYTVDPANIGVTRYWIACYQGITKANGVIGNTDLFTEVPDNIISQEEKNQAIGENHFIRALYYFMLTTRFGGVPLITEQITSLEGVPKSSRESVYQQIILDLDEAIKLCGTKVGLGSENYGRATKGAAYALKGKVHLYLKQYDLAVSAFESVEQDPSNYTLDGVAFADNFGETNEHNAESIFEINFSSSFPEGADGAAWTTSGKGNAETTFRAIEYGNFGNLPVGVELTNAFEVDDPRKDVTIKSDGKWNKYTYPEEQLPNSGINVRVIRMADVLLMKAEALNEINSDGNRTEILSLMNKIRDRVSMPNYGSSILNALFPVENKDQILRAIQHERRIELAGEQVRLNDLLRWGIAEEMIEKNRNRPDRENLEVIIDFIPGKHELLPIPTIEIDTNKALTQADQNFGY